MASKIIQEIGISAKDKFSFDHTPILSAEDWHKLLDKTWTDTE